MSRHLTIEFTCDRIELPLYLLLWTEKGVAREENQSGPSLLSAPGICVSASELYG